jgi:ribosomal protein S18 acetylase RimI-like enzyme
LSEPGFRIRPGRSEDVDFLRLMLAIAADWRLDEPRPLERFADDPMFARYVESWGRAGDLALIAESETGEPLGACWWRLFRVEEPGYGFVSDQIPELALAVRRDARRRGIGTALLAALLEEARERGFSALSLSVEPDNPARRIYERAGFLAWERASEGGKGITMVLPLAPI